VAWGSIFMLWLLLCVRYLRHGCDSQSGTAGELDQSMNFNENTLHQESSSSYSDDESVGITPNTHGAGGGGSDIEQNSETEIELYGSQNTQLKKRSLSSAETISHSQVQNHENNDENDETPLDPLNWSQKVVLFDFMLLVLAWFTRAPHDLTGWSGILLEPSYPSDGTAAMIAALVLFLAPDRNPFLSSTTSDTTDDGDDDDGDDDGQDKKSKRAKGIIEWEVMNALPWDVIFLLGGGIAHIYF
jgi:hypothetical protein